MHGQGGHPLSDLNGEEQGIEDNWLCAGGPVHLSSPNKIGVLHMHTSFSNAFLGFFLKSCQKNKKAIPWESLNLVLTKNFPSRATPASRFTIQLRWLLARALR